MNPPHSPPDDRSWANLAGRVASASDPLIVLRADQSARWAAGNPVPVELYREHFPNLSNDDSLILLRAESGRPRRHGQAPDATESHPRFPPLAADFGLLFDMVPPADPLNTLSEHVTGLRPDD